MYFYFFCFCRERKKTSIIWKFFKPCITDSRMNVCMVCGHKSPNSYTTNSLDHIKLNHFTAYQKVKEEQNAQNDLKDITVHITDLKNENELKVYKKINL